MPQHYFDKNGRYVGSSVTTEEGAQSVREAAGCLNALTKTTGCGIISLILVLSPLFLLVGGAIFLLTQKILVLPDDGGNTAFGITVFVIVISFSVAWAVTKKKFAILIGLAIASMLVLVPFSIFQLPKQIEVRRENDISTQPKLYCPGNDPCKLPLDFRARYAGAEAMTYMRLRGLERSSDQNAVLYLDILVDKGSVGFSLESPSTIWHLLSGPMPEHHSNLYDDDDIVLGSKFRTDVYLTVSGNTIEARHWGGVFGNGRRIRPLNSQGDSPSTLGWIEFEGAWNKILQARCFDLKYGDSYSFSNVCIQ